MLICRLGIAVLFVVFMARAVPRDNFKTCDQSSFCRRCRKTEPGKSPYELLANSANVNESSLYIDLYNKNTNIYYKVQLTALKNNLFRLQINEKSLLKPRYEVQYSLQEQPQLAKLNLLEKTATHITVLNGPNKAVLHVSPFKIDVFSGNKLAISTNARGLMRFEHIRNKPEPKHGETPQKNDQTTQTPGNLEYPGDGAENDPSAWEENFKSHYDSKPNGPEAVALDFSFPGAEQAYGIPEHADSFALKNTNQSEPYRLYNLDVFEYELNERMSLYGAVPVLYTHGKKITSGIFWHNAAETWIDIYSNSDNNVVERIINFVSRTEKKPQVDAHFMSESGIIDVFFLLGPEPMDVFKQFAQLTGTHNLPPPITLEL